MISDGIYACPRREEFKKISKHFYFFKLNITVFYETNSFFYCLDCTIFIKFIL